MKVDIISDTLKKELITVKNQLDTNKTPWTVETLINHIISYYVKAKNEAKNTDNFGIFPTPSDSDTFDLE